MTPPAPGRAPTVGHVMRAYLAPTETFVRNQIVTLRRYRPVVAAHHRRPTTEVPLEAGAVAEDRLAGPLAAAERLVYRAVRLGSPAAMTALARYLRAQDARLLHHHYLTDARFMLGVQRRMELPAVVSAYGYDVSWFPRLAGGLGARYLRPVFGHVTTVLAMSEDMREDLRALGCPDEKLRVHYYGSETRRFRCPARRYDQDGELVVLCCGRLHPGKGQQVVLRALRRLARRGRERFRVVVVGDGPARRDLGRQVSEYGWDGRVVFTGHIPHASPALVAEFARADVFAHPSLTVTGLKEGIPGTIVEAMAAGLPVVATRHAGIPAVITDGREGVLVPEGDEDALADALDALLGDPVLRERLGRAAARRAADQLDLGPATAALERIYDDVLAGGAA